jgi:hypothetical protein
MPQKAYKIPDELHDVYLEMIALQVLRDEYINKKIGGFRKAKKCAIEHEKLKSRFWDGVHKLYPELIGELRYLPEDRKIIIKKATEQK